MREKHFGGSSAPLERGRNCVRKSFLDWHRLRFRDLNGAFSTADSKERRSGVNRRDFLKLSAFASGAVMTGIGGSGRIELIGDERRAAVAVDGEEKWVVDPALFAGRPQLNIHGR